mgnify:CR=1 FL=1
MFKELMDSFLIHYLSHFDKYPFNIERHGDTYHIGDGEPRFTIVVNKDIPKKDFMSSTSLALAEAYMRGDLAVKDGDLFTVIASLLEQADRLALDKHALKDLFSFSEKKRDQAKQVSSHYDLGNDFYALWLDAQNRLIAGEELFRGSLTQTSVYPREVVKRALWHNAAAVVLAHNHPSGVAEPSSADEHLTRALRQALALVDVRVLDHFIVAGAKQPLSFAERGLL